MNVARNFTSDTRQRLLEDYVPRIERAVTSLSPEDFWWQPHEGSTSVGVLLRHLEGNIRQWILSGLGGRPDHRERKTEFEGDAAGEAADLFAKLRATIQEAADVIGAMDEDALAKRHAIQGYDVTGLEAAYHVVEHLSWHAGQIVWIAKARGGPDHGIAFYDDEKLNTDKNA